MTKIIKVECCRECPYLRYPWSSALCTQYSCSNSFVGNEKPHGEKTWLGGNASPGERIISDPSKIQSWCALGDTQ